MKTLLLDRVYQPVAFITFRRMAKMIAKNKVDIIETWPELTFYGGLEYPAVLRLKDYVRKKPRIPRFNRRGVFRRDDYICQYSGERLSPSKLTVDHVLPRAQGGKSTWENCVACSLEMNALKGDRTPEQAGMKLLSKPTAPIQSLAVEYKSMAVIHPEWGNYFPSV